MQFLTDDERQVLNAFCDTIHPALTEGDRQCQNRTEPLELGVTRLVEQAISHRDKRAQDRFRLLLNLLQRRTVNGVLAGHWAPFTRLTFQQRTDVLLAMANSPFNRLRGAFQGVKQLVSFLSYAAPEHLVPSNPYLQAINYQRSANGVEDTGDALPTMSIDSSRTIHTDVLVVGSGPGGAVVAAELAAAGQSVLIVEKGDYFSNANLPDNELDGMRKLYDGGGSLRSADRAFIILAGSTLGGGTTVNWMTCLDPPEQLLHQWAGQCGFKAATSREFRDSLNAISQRINVTQQESTPNFQNHALERGCHALGYQCSVIKRNVNGCVRCDFCSFGCRYGAKQDMRRTYLRDAVDAGAEIVVKAFVERIDHQAGVATGAQMLVTDNDGKVHEVTVKCKTVVLAAGAIRSPVVLMRSGLTNRNIGHNLFLHPVGAVFAKYREPVHAWKGASQTRVCEEFADLDGDGYGFRLEVSPAHPGLWALGLPWQGGTPFRQLMRQVPHLANTIALTRDKFPGYIQVSSNGEPVIQYKLHPYDGKHLMQGLEQAIRVHRAAGAEVVYGPHNDCQKFDCSGSEAEFDQYLKSIHRTGMRPNHLGLFCAHQMSSCRIGESSQSGAVTPEGETYEIRNLFVTDGSVLPTSTGVNPMVTILTMAHHLAQHIKSRLPVG